MPTEEVFKRFDTDGSGELDLEEFKVMLKKLKIHMSDAPVAGGVVFACNGSL